MRYLALLLFWAFVSPPEAGVGQPMVPAFPGAEGFGAGTPAGRGGQVIRVKNLNDSGPGSLREAAAATEGPRIVVFDVGGTIVLESPLTIRHPYLTIAGQTAPAPGITLADFGIRIHSHDILIQHLFVRINPHLRRGGGDGIAIKFNSPPDDPRNIVIDHCSISWANDENVSVFAGYGNKHKQNVTISNCLIAEGHYGLLLAQSSTFVSVIRNLVMSSLERYPRIAGGCAVNLVNNLFYNTTRGSFTVLGDGHEGPDDVTAVGNVYIGGPETPVDHYAISTTASASPGTRIYAPDKGAGKNLARAILRPNDVSFSVTQPPVPIDNITVIPAEEVLQHIVNSVGARPSERWTDVGNRVDQRLITELLSGEGSAKDRLSPLWGHPETTYRNFSAFLPAEPGGDDDSDGFTNIEEVLEQMAATLEGRRVMTLIAGDIFSRFSAP